MHDNDYTNTLLRTDYIPTEEDFLNLRKVRLSHEEALLNSKKKHYKIKIRSDYFYMRFAGELRADKDFIFDVIYDDYWGFADLRPLKFISEEIKSDKEFMLKLMEHGSYALLYASDKLKADKEIILAATDFAHFRLEFANDALKDDEDIALAAIKNCSFNYEHVSNRLKKDKKLALTAVRLDGRNLEHVSQELKKNNEVVSCAVKNDVYAIEFANHDIDIYRDMALLVVQRDGCYLPELKPSMRDDAEIVCVAMRSCEKAKFYASARLQNILNLIQPFVSKKRCMCPSEIG